MKKLINRFKRSLPARLLLVFILFSLFVSVLIIGTLFYGFSSQWQSGVRPHLEQYLSYVNADIGNPPSPEIAQQLANELPINIYIVGGSAEFSSTGVPLDLSDIEFERKRPWRKRDDKYQKNLKINGQSIAFGEHHDRTVLRSQIGDYKVYYELQHKERSLERDDFVGHALVFLLLILLVSYFLLRRMLRPVQDIKAGVMRMGQGELDYRVPIRSDNDLGDLANSINNMASDIEGMLDAKRQLLLAVSHELRSPLTRAKIAVQMLEESNKRDSIEEDLSEMESLISEILETERMNSRHAALNRVPVDMASLVGSVLVDLPAINVRTDIMSNMPMFELDDTRIRLLLRNLVSNADKHGGNAQPAPLIKVDHTKNTVRLSVTDFGPGIAKEHLSHVTEPFYRADPSRTRATGGFGLGLYLCKLIVQAHGGELKIESEESAGTVITAYLPT